MNSANIEKKNPQLGDSQRINNPRPLYGLQ